MPLNGRKPHRRQTVVAHQLLDGIGSGLQRRILPIQGSSVFVQSGESLGETYLSPAPNDKSPEVPCEPVRSEMAETNVDSAGKSRVRATKAPATSVGAVSSHGTSSMTEASATAEREPTVEDQPHTAQKEEAVSYIPHHT